MRVCVTHWTGAHMEPATNEYGSGGGASPPLKRARVGAAATAAADVVEAVCERVDWAMLPVEMLHRILGWLIVGWAWPWAPAVPRAEG